MEINLSCLIQDSAYIIELGRAGKLLIIIGSDRL